MATPADHEHRIERLYEGVWNGSNPDVANELVGPTYVIHDRDVADELQGPALYTALADGTREIFPDMTLTIEDLFATGDRVAVRWEMIGTHEGPLQGIEPTGRTVRLRGIEINRFEDGVLAETWAQSDMLGLLEQLDAAPHG